MNAHGLPWKLLEPSTVPQLDSSHVKEGLETQSAFTASGITNHRRLFKQGLGSQLALSDPSKYRQDLET